MSTLVIRMGGWSPEGLAGRTGVTGTLQYFALSWTLRSEWIDAFDLKRCTAIRGQRFGRSCTVALTLRSLTMSWLTSFWSRGAGWMRRRLTRRRDCSGSRARCWPISDAEKLGDRRCKHESFKALMTTWSRRLGAEATQRS